MHAMYLEHIHDCSCGQIVQVMDKEMCSFTKSICLCGVYHCYPTQVFHVVIKAE